MMWAVLVMAVVWVSCQPQQEKWDSMLEKESRWTVVESPATFSWEEGSLVCSGTAGTLIFNDGKEYRDFVLEAEVMTAPGSFAEILFHQSLPAAISPAQGYGVIIGNSPEQNGDLARAMKTGSLAGIRHLYFPMAEDGEWFTLRVRVSGNQAETFINGVRVMEYIQPLQPWRSAATGGRLFSSGTFAVRHTSGTVKMRSLKVKTPPSGRWFP